MKLLDINSTVLEMALPNDTVFSQIISISTELDLKVSLKFPTGLWNETCRCLGLCACTDTKSVLSVDHFGSVCWC